MKKRLALLAIVWIVAIVVGLRSYRQVRDQHGAGAVCEAVSRGDWPAALEISEGLVGTDEPGLRAAGCRSQALVGMGDLEGAVALLETLLADPETGDWLPDPFLVITVAAGRRLAGRLPEAIQLARRGSALYPDNRELLMLELDLRSEVEDQEAVLEEITQRLVASGRAQSTTGFFLALQLVDRERPDLAEVILGPEPPPGDDQELFFNWFKLRTLFHAHQGESEKITANSQRWLEAGGQEAEILTYEAVYRSLFQIQDSRYPQLSLLEEAARRQAEVADRKMVFTLYSRLIGSLVTSGRPDDALAVFDQADQEFDFPPGRREEILRVGEQAPVRERQTRRGRLRFSLPRAIPGARLWVSPDSSATADTEFESHEFDGLQGNSVVIDRSLADVPQRWVLRDAGQQVLASGTVWPTASSIVDVAITPQAPRSNSDQLQPTLPTQAAADGRRRVMLMILDCADWRLVQYLRARSDLPMLDAMIRRGQRGVLLSDPPFTAAALRSLVFPKSEVTISVVESIHRLGSELAGNTFVDGNPVAFLDWLLPESTTLFDTLGAGEHTTVNFLYASGSMEAGDHGEQVGPRGKKGRFTQWQLRRRLEPGEAKIRQDEIDRQGYGGVLLNWFEEIAALFDASIEIARTPEIDLALLRVAPLDLASHRGYADISRTAQDNATYPIYAIYRYIDRRLGKLYGQLDGDDVLVVMSDHGIKNSAMHDPRCLFVAVGGQVTAGRIDGMPHLRGVARMLADLMGVPTPWPQTGIETWVQELP